MANWLFNASAQGWSEDGGLVWDVTDGSPGLGCMLTSFGGELATTVIDGLSIAVIEGDPFSFRAKVMTVLEDAGTATVTLSMNGAFGADEAVIVPAETFDSGWFLVSGTITALIAATSPVTEIEIEWVSTGGTIYKFFVDSVYMAEAPPGGTSYVLTRSAGGVPGSVAI